MTEKSDKFQIDQPWTSSIALLLIVVYVLFLAELLSLVKPDMNGWLVVLIASLTPMFISQIFKEFRLVK